MDLFGGDSTGTSETISLFVIILLVLGSIWLCRRTRFHTLPPPIEFHPISFMQTLGAFLIYFLLLPIFILILVFSGRIQVKEALAGEGWLQSILVASLFVSFVGYCALIKPATRLLIFWGNRKPTRERVVRSIGAGAFTWLLSYPWVLLVSSVTALIARFVWHVESVDQVAIRELKKVADNPILFAITGFSIIFIIPFIEELLFRGFLQSFLRKHLKRWGALITTAALFSCMHFSRSQGIGNFQLIVSLFTLSLFLGFLYEKQQTLLASYTLHATFNAITVILLAFQIHV